MKLRLALENSADLEMEIPSTITCFLTNAQMAMLCVS